MQEKHQSLRFPSLGFKSDVFITAKPAGLANDEIFARGANITMGGVATQTGIVTVSPAAAFVGKCIVQIVDFSIPIQTVDGEIETWRYKADGAGDNYHNRQFYEQLLFKEAIEAHDLIDGFLDFIDGRDTQTAKDFEELKNEQPLLLTDS